MESKEIIDGSKIIAEYMNFVYLPFSAELKEKGMKAGYYQTVSAEPKIEKTIVNFGDEQKEMNLNMNLFRYHNKNGWKFYENKYYKFVCRHHGGLRFYNSFDAIIPVIEKIEKEKEVGFYLNNNGCGIIGNTQYQEFHNKDLTWIQNTFNAVVKYLETKSEAHGRLSRN